MPAVHCRGAALALVSVLVLTGCGSSTGPGDHSGSLAKLDDPEEQGTFSCSEDTSYLYLSGSVGVCEKREFKDMPTGGSVSLRPSDATFESAYGTDIMIQSNELPAPSARAQGTEATAVSVVAYIYAAAASEAEAREVLSQVVIHNDNGDFYATGPNRSRGIVTPLNPGVDWSVSFDAILPHRTDFSAKASAGSVIAKDLTGRHTLQTSSGGIKAQRLAGNVIATTSSGDLLAEALDGTLSLSTSSGNIAAMGLSGTSVIETSSGEVEAGDLDGNTRITSSGGGVQVARSVGTLIADTGSGEFQAEKLDGDIQFLTSSGDVVLSEIQGRLRGNTSSGNIDLDLMGDGWAGDGADISTSSGHIQWSAPQTYSANFEFITTSGNVSSEFSGKSLDGPVTYSETVGQGGKTLRAQTSSGDITLSQKD